MVIVVAIKNESDVEIVEEGAALAAAFDVPLHLVHVIDLSDRADDISTGYTDESLNRLETVGIERVETAARHVERGYEAECLIGEDVVESLLAYVNDHDANYLVIGGRRRSPVGKAVFGSVTQSLLLAATCPVLTIFDS